MGYGFLTPEDTRGESPLFGKIWDWLQEEREERKKEDKNISGKLDKVLQTVGVNVSDVTEKKSPAYKMLRGDEPKALLGAGQKQLPSGQKALPPGGPRLPGSAGPTKGGTITNISSAGGLNADTFFKQAQTGVGPSGEYLTNSQRREAFIKSRQETVKTAAATNAPAISPDSGADIVAAVNRNTEVILNLVKVTKDQTANDTRLSEKQALIQEKMLSRQRSAAEEANLEQSNKASGFLTPESLKKVEKKARGGGGYGSGGDRLSRAQDLLDIGSDIADMRKGKVRRVTPGRDGRTSRQRLRDMQARRAGVNPSRGGGLARTGGSALGRGSALGQGLGRGAGALGGAGKVARGLGKAGPLALLTAGLEFGDRMSSGQNAFQAGVGTAGSVGGGLAGAAAGAAIGSIVPGVGTLIGGAIGGLLGSMAGGGVADIATGANKVQAANGVIASGSPFGFPATLHGTEAVFPLDGKKGQDTFKMFGEGLLSAQKSNRSDYAKLQSEGLKQYFERDGGIDKFGGLFGGLKDVLGNLGNGLKDLAGGLANAALGGAANAGEMPGMGMSADEQQLTEALIAGEEGVRTKAYQDSSGIWTIGYGQTTLNGRAVKQGDQISKEEALAGFRSNVKSHAQRAISQVGEERWKQLDPKARAVLTSLAYNYGSIPEAVLPAAKSGTTEEIAKSMDKLYGHNKGVLKGRRQREQSILRGGTSDRLDKDFLAGGKFAGQGTGPSVFGSPGSLAGSGGGSAGSLASAAESLRNMSTAGGPDGGQNGCVYAVNKVFNKAGIKPPWGSSLYVPDADAKMQAAGWQQVSYANRRPGDVMVMKDRKSPPQAHIGVVVSNGNVLSNSSGRAAYNWEASPEAYDRYYGGKGVLYRMPGGSAPLLAGKQANPGSGPVAAGGSAIPINGAAAANAPKPPAAGFSPTPVAAAPAAANTGTPMMATSAQVAMAGAQQPIVVNNYYTSAAGGGGMTGAVPNNLTAGPTMDDMGLSAFSQLKLRSLG